MPANRMACRVKLRGFATAVVDCREITQIASEFIKTPFCWRNALSGSEKRKSTPDALLARSDNTIDKYECRGHVNRESFSLLACVHGLDRFGFEPCRASAPQNRSQPHPRLV